MSFASDNVSTSKFCIAPWSVLHIDPSGDVFPCCRSGGSKLRSLGNIQSQSLAQIWNGVPMQKFRQSMLDGKNLKLFCFQCYADEDVNALSYRQKINQLFLKQNNSSALSSQSSLRQIKYLDLRISNFCNLRCRTCGPKYSSAWHEDYLKLEGLPQTDLSASVALNKISQDTLQKLIAMNLSSIENLHFAGGEPFLIPEHQTFIKSLPPEVKKQISLSYDTNFTSFSWALKRFSFEWENFKQVHFSISLDAEGDRSRHVRHGTDWLQMKKNLDLIFENTNKNFYFSFNITVSLLNLSAIEELYWDLHARGLLSLKPSSYGPVVNFNLLNDPSYYSIQCLPVKTKQFFATGMQTFMEKIDKKNLPGSDQVKSILDFMSAQDLSSQLPKFIEITRQLDQIRGESSEFLIKEILPPLDSENLLPAT